MTARSSAATYSVENGSVDYDQSGKFTDAIKLESTGTNENLPAENIAITVNPVSSNFYLNSNSAWTVEYFVKHLVFPLGATNSVYFNIATDKDTDANVRLKNGASPNNLYWTPSGQNYQLENAWKHIAIVSNGTGSISFYYDGARLGSTNYGYTDTATSNRRTIRFNIPTAEDSGFGYAIDEVRISNNQRYTGNSLTVPTTAFTDDDNTLALFHFDDNNPQDDWTTRTTANLSASFALTATPVSNPNIVYLGNDLYTWDQTDTWQGFSIHVDRWNRLEEKLTSQFTVTSVGIRVDVGSANLSSSAAISARGAVVKPAQANLSSTTTLSVAGERLPQGSANLSAIATVSAKANLELNAVSQLTSVTTISATARNLKLADIFITDFATLTADADLTQNSKANLTSAFTQTARGGLLITLDDVYDYTWDTIVPDEWNGFVKDQWGPEGWFAFDNVNLSALGGLELNARSDLLATATVSAIAQKIIEGSSDLSSMFNVTVLGDRIPGGEIKISAAFTLTATAEEFDFASAELSAVFTQTAKGGLLQSGSAVISDALNFNINAERIRTVKCNISAETTLICRPTLIPSVQIDQLLVISDLTSIGQRLPGGRADLSAFTATLTVGQRLPGGQANLSAEFEIRAFAGVIQTSGADLEAFVSTLSDSRISNVRGSANLNSAFATIFAGDLKLFDSEFIVKILRETRRFDIDSETRILDILPDSRIINVDSETRKYRILEETRTLEV